MPENHQHTLERMDAMLRHCRRRIVMDRMAAGFKEGLRLCLGWLPGIAGVFLLLRILAWAFETPAPGGAPLGAAVILLAAVILGRTMVRRSPVRTREAAERLDLAQATHNRIATAISLLKSGDDSPFARAAIRDGWETLDRLRSAEPQITPSPLCWRRAGLFLAAAAALVLAGFLIFPKHGSGDIPAARMATPSIARNPPSGETDATDEKADRQVDPAKPGLRENIPVRPETASNRKPDRQPESAIGARSEGTAGQHATGESRNSRAASNSRSAASGGGANAKPGDGKPEAPKPNSRDGKKAVAGEPKPPRTAKQAGSINASGSSGTGSTRTAQDEWSSKIEAKSDDSDNPPQDEEPDENMDPDKQRLGAQPALKNRAAEMSRELSLATGTKTANQQNRGRGGPSGQKKSRGTATMIMGVPVPGFVRGRLLPGPTKSTQEQVEPVPREGESAALTTMPRASPTEDSQERFRPAAAVATQARNYLLNYHAEHDKPRSPDAAAE